MRLLEEFDERERAHKDAEENLARSQKMLSDSSAEV